MHITRLLSLVVERPPCKRKVVGSIPTGGFDDMGRGFNPHCGLPCYEQAVLSLEAQWRRWSFSASLGSFLSFNRLGQRVPAAELSFEDKHLHTRHSPP